MILVSSKMLRPNGTLDPNFLIQNSSPYSLKYYVFGVYFNDMGRNSPSSTIIVFSTSRAFHKKVTNIKLR